MTKHAANFRELVETPFANGINALCWQRTLPGDFGEIVKLLGRGDGVIALDEDRLRSLELSAKGLEAVNAMLSDLHLLREQGRDPVLNIIYGYPRDEDGGPIPTDVLSWHVDSAPIEADTWLCTYHGAPSEGLHPADAVRKVDNPKIRSQLLDLYHRANGKSPALSGVPRSPMPPEALAKEGESFTAWLTENHYDLHYAPLPGAKPYSFGVGHLWRIAIEWPGNRLPLQNPQLSGFRSQVSVSLPCVHRAPASDTPRLLLIS